MPARHRYKCLNTNCPSMTDARKSMTFVAMNMQPACPHCACIKLEDWGEAINVMDGASDNTRNSDANFRRIADRYGLTDMNNKDGQAVKRAAPVPANSGSSVNVGGIQVSMNEAASGSCVHIPSMAQKIPVSENAPQKKSSPMMKRMTNVVAEHRA